MAREKMKLEYVTDEPKRKVSFRKRRDNVEKKARELSILCDVDVAAIVFSGHSDPDPDPKVWPNDQELHRFLGTYHGRQLLEKTMSQEGLLQQRLNKEKEHLKKRSNENYEEEISQLLINYMAGYANLPMLSGNAFELKMKVDQHLKEIDMAIEASGKEDEVYIPAPPVSDGLLINGENEKLADQSLHYGMGSDNWNDPSCWNNMENLEYYMAFGASDMPQPFHNTNYQHASSSNNPFYP